MVIPILATDAADESVHNWVVSHRVSWLNDPVRFVTDLAGWSVVFVGVVCVLIFLLRKRRHQEAVFLLVVVLGAQILSRSLKSLFDRARPDLVDHLVTAGDASLPSGHALQAVATYGALAIVFWRCGWVKSKALLWTSAGVLCFLIGVSRVYLGVHWPTDVLAGWLVGGAWLATNYFTYGRHPSAECENCLSVDT